MSGFLLDSNLIIYGAQPDGEKIREFIKEHAPQVSVISKVETLGYHSLEEEERAHLERFFKAAIVLPSPIISSNVPSSFDNDAQFPLATR